MNMTRPPYAPTAPWRVRVNGKFYGVFYAPTKDEAIGDAARWWRGRERIQAITATPVVD
jgi:hypothetical protein